MLLVRDLAIHFMNFCSNQQGSKTILTLGHISVPFMMRFRATCSLPVTSSSRAEAIHAGG